MHSPPSIYEDLDVPTVVNAAGTKTRVGGSLIRAEAAEAMRDAANGFAHLSDLQSRASELIAEATGAEAGYVTCGASAALLLASAACIAGDDLAAMARLPDTEDLPSEIVMPRTHRTGYDHALRAAGATIVDVGTNDPHLGTGASAVKAWELDAAIGPETVAVAYVEKPYLGPDLSDVVEIAHANDVPVIVDAAAELPPTKNLSAFVETGADLVAFSGGKAIRGPQTTGILAGRRELIESVALQHLDWHVDEAVWQPPAGLIDRDRVEGVPRQGIGRSAKVGKEEIVGLIRALELFREEDQDALKREWRARAERIADGLDGRAGIEAKVDAASKTAVSPEVTVRIDDYTDRSACSLVHDLFDADPRIVVGADGAADGELTISPMCLTDAEADLVVDRVLSFLDVEPA